jgi:hypothetical protein
MLLSSRTWIQRRILAFWRFRCIRRWRHHGAVPSSLPARSMIVVGTRGPTQSSRAKKRRVLSHSRPNVLLLLLQSRRARYNAGGGHITILWTMTTATQMSRCHYTSARNCFGIITSLHSLGLSATTQERAVRRTKSRSYVSLPAGLWMAHLQPSSVQPWSLVVALEFLVD